MTAEVGTTADLAHSEPVSVDLGRELELSSAQGRALPSNDLTYFQQRFRTDFSQVRIHDDSSAHRMARELGARAFAQGRHIYFGAGETGSDPKVDRDLLAHELTHVVQQRSLVQDPERGDPGLIQRKLIRDKQGDPEKYGFRKGKELQPSFLRLARRLVRGLAEDSGISDDGLRRLRQSAVARRGTVSDPERLFMAGLLAPDNVRIFKRRGRSASFSFPVDSLSRARRDHVNNLDRQLPVSVSNAMGDVEVALSQGQDWRIVVAEQRLEAVAAAAIVNQLGISRRRAQSLLSYLAKHKILVSETLQAMIQAASDNSRGDRFMAGVVFAIAKQVDHPMAPKIRRGEVKVDALVPRAFARVPEIGDHVAAYVPLATTQGVKGDTIYVQRTIGVSDPVDRSYVIHELQHAHDDAAGGAGRGRSETPASELEYRAYIAQANYLYNQLAGRGGRTRGRLAYKMAMRVDTMIELALIVAGRANVKRNKALFELLNALRPQGRRLNQTTVDTAFTGTRINWPIALRQRINSLYGFPANAVAKTDGLSGESILDHAHRI